MKFYTFLVLLLISSLASVAQKVISGKVVSDDDKLPLPGVSVKISKSNAGTLTDVNGNFKISAKPEDILIFSFIGFDSKTVTVGNQTNLSVSLRSSNTVLDEIAVVGYGTQKKVNLTGSVQTLRLDSAVNTPVTNSAQLMYGKFSGVQLTQGSGLPGADASSVIIRGIGTFGNSNPLVVIDDIQYSGLGAFNNLAPSDIETISVLKDASASAIYGARGANGVIVVTTKKGKSGALDVSYNVYQGFQNVTVVPEYLDAVDYAILRNERDINLNGANAPIRYSPANIQAIIDGTNPDQYSNTRWSDVILRTAPIQNHYLSFAGGNDKTTFRVSLGYLNQEAVVRGKFENERFNLSLNINSKLKNWLTVSNVTNTYWTKFRGPSGGAGAITGETGIINQFQRSAPTIPVYYSSGEFGTVDGSYQNVNFSYPINHPLRTGQLGDHTNDDINIAERIGVKANITKNLSFETSGAINLNYGMVSNFTPRFTTVDFNGDIVSAPGNNTLSNSTDLNYRLLNENILRYAKVFNKDHDVSVLAGHSVIYGRSDSFSGSLQGFPSDLLQEFNAGGVLNPSVAGGANEESLQSFFSRVNYAYKGKYLVEVNFRRDGSSRFGPNRRYGNFPSASAGWRISEESFMKNFTWLSELKLRGSWGITGNDNIDNYIYEQYLNTNLDYYVGSSVVPGVALTRLSNPNISWEQVEQFDIGLDADLFKNRLSVSADYFRRSSSEVLYSNFPIPSTIGVNSLSAQNAANMVNEGIEANFSFRGKINEFNYTLSGNVSKFADNKVTSLGFRGVETISGNNIIRIGQPFNAYYGYKVEGIFQTDDEVANAPRQFGSPLTRPGDFRYADLSGPAGVPDGVIDAFDRTVIGNPYPSWLYGFSGNFNYKGIDLAVTFQGVHGLDRILNSNGQQPMPDDRNNGLSYWLNRWTPENPSTELPRLGGVNNTVISDFYVQDVSFLRLRNLELGYTIPSILTKKYGISRLRFYLSGQNILTFTKLENFDPERERGGATDRLTPLYKIYSFGLNLKF
ncbi:SusC/RagA family TonB-linked outer membrane protein [Pedobacter puniceum]|jgi:TonB-linked SusC/RagA family outer membrane protein|uniref:SusC/RagA family TonB-linked outer membrane protein n=1 Tax=Pedobacter puniceum TaxID=2666136 RepID=A0A7K0FM13_9SPHI|nr:TonB-dependent receptor [Pedobacter puniceum]MRX47006.1 SusC/RagA family TonB-linked outer membrane protein [Pedobacter puniceum]